MSDQEFPTIGTAEERSLRQRLHALENLLQQVEKFPDPQAQAQTREIVGTLMEFHGEALRKIVEHLAASGEAGPGLVDSLAKDDLVAGVLLLYGLHPLDFEARVRQALEKVRPYLASHGGNVELLGVVDGVVRLRLQGSCHGCPSSAMTLKQTIEEAIYEKAPDAAAIEVEGELTQTSSQNGVDLGAAQANRMALPILSH